MENHFCLLQFYLSGLLSEDTNQDFGDFYDDSDEADGSKEKQQNRKDNVTVLVLVAFIYLTQKVRPEGWLATMIGMIKVILFGCFRHTF